MTLRESYSADYLGKRTKEDLIADIDSLITRVEAEETVISLLRGQIYHLRLTWEPKK
jgi:hypothetical protein